MDKTFIFIALGMIITGSINTISTKLADVTKSDNRYGEKEVFNHPFFQAVGMFVGEFLCMIAFKIGACYNSYNNRPVDKAKFNPAIFILPALCDMTATSLMYLGLTWTYPSVFQMLRGAVVIFTGILSVIFLKRKLYLFHWISMFIILGGLALVGVASVFSSDSNDTAPHPLLGDIIIVVAQSVVAVQMVVEEKFISKHNVPPLQVVGWEGFWGFCALSLLMIPFYFITIGHSHGHPVRLEDSYDAVIQIKNSWIIAAAIGGNIISIAFFNFFGISMTRYKTATTRTVLDSVRTVTVWGFSLLVGWQSFQYLQIIGFTLLMLGTLLYNEVIIIPIPGLRPPPKPTPITVSEKDPLLSRETGSVQDSDA